MPDDPNTNQETSQNAPISPNSEVNMGSEPSNMPLEAPETSKNTDIPVSLNNTNPENSLVLTQNPEVSKPAESASAEAENPKVEPISEPVQTSETQTAQIPGIEPLASEPEPIKPEPVPVIIPNKNKVLELLNKAKNAIQFRKRKKLDKIMTLFLKQSKITNDEVEKFLHVSDATATRYLSQLEKENKIKQTGKTGHSVFYSKI